MRPIPQDLSIRSIGWLVRHPRLMWAIAAGTLLAAIVAGVVGAEALIRVRLDAAGSTGPTRVYARSVVWRPGDQADMRRVERDLRRRGYRVAPSRRVGIGEYRLESDHWIIGRRPFRLPSGLDSGGVTEVRLDWDGRINAVHDQANAQLSSLILEPQLVQTVHGADLADRVPVTLAEVPRHLVDAILTAEDRRFFEHGGLDFQRVAGAALANARAGRLSQGASTITQQLARTLWLSRRRSPWRKIREIAMAKVLEWRYTKDEILEGYLNEVYLGQDGALAIRGVGRASQYYFGKDVTELGVGESALLAGIIRGPILYGPFRNADVARTRRDLVLDLMRERGVLEEREQKTAKRAAVRLRARPEAAGSGRYFSDWVLQTLAERGYVDPGLAVFTTMDADFQQAAGEAVAAGLERLERDYPALRRDSQPLQASLVALDPHTGEVLALVGGRDYRTTQYNRAIQSRRQPGSAFKPVVALAALSPEAPHPLSPSPLYGEGGFSAPPAFTLASQLDDEPLELETTEGIWRPVNYDGTFGGPVTLRDALERSLNVPFARLGLAVGPARIADAGHALGIESPLREVPSLALGASEVTLLELTRAFGVLAAYGYRATTLHTLGVVDPAGELVDHSDAGGERVTSPAVAYLVTSALRGVVERGTARGLRGWGVDGPVAGKTGTTNENRDAWFVGYTPDLAVGVWVGFDDGRSLGLSGAGAALPIFADFVRRAAADPVDDFPVPEGVQFAYAGTGCEREAFLEGTVPEGNCITDWNPLRPVEDGVRSLLRGLKRLFGGGR